MPAVAVETLYVILRNNQACEIDNVTSCDPAVDKADLSLYNGSNYRNTIDAAFLGRSVNAQQEATQIVSGPPVFYREEPATISDLDMFAALSDEVTATPPFPQLSKQSICIFIRKNPLDGTPLTPRWFYNKDIKGISDKPPV